MDMHFIYVLPVAPLLLGEIVLPMLAPNNGQQLPLHFIVLIVVVGIFICTPVDGTASGR